MVNVKYINYEKRYTIVVDVASKSDIHEISLKLGKPLLKREYDSKKYGRTREYLVIDCNVIYVYREHVGEVSTNDTFEHK